MSAPKGELGDEGENLPTGYEAIGHRDYPGAFRIFGEVLYEVAVKSH